MGGGASNTLHNDHPLKTCSSQQLNTANNFMRCFVHSINEFVAVTSANSTESPSMNVETSDALNLCISSFENLLKVCNLEASDRAPVAKMLGFATVLATERTVLAAKSGETVYTSLESKDPAKENMSMAHSSKVIPPLQARSSKHFEPEVDAMQTSELPNWCSPEDFKLYDMLRNVANEGKHFHSRMLAEKDIFVLDNSIQESTSANNRGHSIADKQSILSAVKQCGISNSIVSSFEKLPLVTEDAWVANLQENNFFASTGGYCYGHSELFDSVDEMQWPVADADPIGLVKIKQYKIPNAVFSVDVMNGLVSWEDQGGSCPISTFADLIKLRIQDVRSINPDARVFINFRDAPTAFKSVVFAYRLIQLTKFLATLPLKLRPYGILFEDATGESFPWEFGNLCHVLIATMENSGWADGQLLVHVNKKFGLAESCVLQALASGATGIWGGITDDGPACGSAGLFVTLANLSRLGNEYVKREYNFEKLFAAAKQIAGVMLTSSEKQEVYGKRALDIFVGDNNLQLTQSFSFYAYVGVKDLIAIDHTTPAAVIRDRFSHAFGKTAGDFSLDICKKVKAVMWEATTEGRKYRYSSAGALLDLYKRAGGTDLLDDMQCTVQESNVKSATADNHPLMLALRSVFDAYSGVKPSPSEVNNLRLTYMTFYHAFLSHYLADTTAEKLGLYCSVIDDQEPGFVSWNKVSAHAKNLLVEQESVSGTWDANDVVAKFVELKVLPLVYLEAEARKREATNK